MTMRKWGWTLLGVLMVSTMGVAEPVQVKMSTNVGDMVLELDADKAPISVKNFLEYAESGFYEGTVFHRVIANFMAQGGGFDEKDEQKKTRDPIKNESGNGLKNTFGTLSMARTAVPDSATSQFFINLKDNDFLNKDQSQDGVGYCVFGKVVAGEATLLKIKQAPVVFDPKMGSVSKPKSAIVITKVAKIKAGDGAFEAVKKADAEAMKELGAQKAAAAEPKAGGADDLTAAKNYVKKLGHDPEQGKTSSSGLWYLDVKVGDGPLPASSKSRVTVHYTGWLTNGDEFDSSRKRGQTISFGLNQVIAGWSEGVLSMKTGGRRILVIPYKLGYGERGQPPTIPPKATLVFDIELFKVDD